MMKRFFYVPLLAALALLGSCYPEGPEYVDQLDLVVTNYDPNTDFKAMGTFAISDSIVKITGDAIYDPDGDGRPAFVNQSYAGPIVDRIRENMVNRGWVEVDKNSNPDVILLTSAMQTDNVFYYYDWWYWGWYYPGYDPYWGWYYPGYYPPAMASYQSGSLFIQMTVPSQIGPNDHVKVAWTGVFNGLLEGSTTNIVQRVGNSIDQAFKQSPYLQQ